MTELKLLPPEHELEFVHFSPALQLLLCVVHAIFPVRMLAEHGWHDQTG